MGQMHKADLHQQTGFTTGTVADDDELATDLSHGCYRTFACLTTRSGCWLAAAGSQDTKKGRRMCKRKKAAVELNSPGRDDARWFAGESEKERDGADWGGSVWIDVGGRTGTGREGEVSRKRRVIKIWVLAWSGLQCSLASWAGWLGGGRAQSRRAGLTGGSQSGCTQRGWGGLPAWAWGWLLG